MISPCLLLMAFPYKYCADFGGTWVTTCAIVHFSHQIQLYLVLILFLLLQCFCSYLWFWSIWNTFLFVIQSSWCTYTSIFIQVGIPIAAGVLFPINGTVLTPSIAGALMGLSSIGVMTNSLLLRFKFSSKQKQIHSISPKTKIHVAQNQKTNHPY